MDVIVCVDDQWGMCFNHRRQSRDRFVIADIVHHCKTLPIWMNAYSAALFPKEKIVVNEEFLKKAPSNACCFVEDQPLLPVVEDIDTLIVYHWNRRYPADRFLDISIQEWNLIKKEDFSGYSHEKITREEYHR